MKTLMKIGMLFNEAETEIPAIEPIVTGYGDMKVPGMTIAVLIFSILLLIAFGVAAFLLLKDRTFGWQQPLLVSAIAYILFTSLLYMGVLVGISNIPPLEARFNENMNLYATISIIWAILMELAAMYFGYRFIVKRMQKSHGRVNLAVPLGMGVGFYVMGILISSELSNFLYYIMYAVNVNSVGLDAMVTSMVEQGADVREATEAVIGFASQSPMLFLMDALSYVFKAVVETGGLIAIYGVLTEKLEKKWLIFGFGIVPLYFIPNVIATFWPESPIWLRLLIVLLIVAGAVYASIYMVKKYMPEDVNMLKHSIRRDGGGSRKNKQQPPRMPKIVMPD